MSKTASFDLKTTVSANRGVGLWRMLAGYRLRTICRELGLITLTLHPGNVLFLAPPLTIKPEEVEQMVDVVDRALAIYEQRYLV